jgi:hypothetical protein
MAAKLGGKPFFNSLNAAGKTLAKQAQIGQYSHISQNLEVSFNGGKVADGKHGLHMFFKATSFGKPSAKARQEMKSRVQTATKEVPDQSIFFQVTIKLKESFTDPNGFFAALCESDIINKETSMDLHMSYENGSLIFYGVAEAPKNEVAEEANKLFSG